MLSTKHRSDAVVGEQRRPEVIHYYNQTKAGVDTMDKMLGTNTTKRKTKSWPLALFYNILDIAALAAYIICCNSKGSAKASRRRLMITETGENLCYPLIQQRAANKLSVRHFSTKNAIECMMGMSIDEINSGQQLDDFTPNDGKEKDKTGRQKHTGNCYACKDADNHRRSTRKSCSVCKKAVCYQHSVDMHMTQCESCYMK